MGHDPVANRRIYAGLYAISLATLAYEILLTRVFSATMWYHFAFMAISIAMFGLTVGGLVVYLHPSYADPAKARWNMIEGSLGFAAAVVATFLVYLFLPVMPATTLAGFARLALVYALIAVPFAFSGVVACLALTKFPSQVSRLYAADLAGAATGCVALIFLLSVTDAITSVAVVALVGILAALLMGDRKVKAPRAGRLMAVTLLAFSVFNTILVHRQTPLLRLMWVKGSYETRPIYEKWNSFSRITVYGDPDSYTPTMTEGVSGRWYFPPARQLVLRIDSSAETTLTALPANPTGLSYLAADVKEFVYWLRPHSTTLIVGAGGGRDVLAALLFGEKSIRAVEINPDIIKTVNERFGDFTGHLDRNPHVRFINDEARSYIARHTEPTDVIEISFIDTWAATAAGAFALTENSLYTVEAWKLFLSRLTPNGILSVTRWYFPDGPAQSYRLLTLAATALKQSGFNDPRGHIIFLVNIPPGQPRQGRYGAGTILVSKAPFSQADLDKTRQVAAKMGFDVLVTPQAASDSNFALLASGEATPAALARFPFDLSPPTDNHPFFFQTGRLTDIFHLSRLGLRAQTLGEQPVLLVVGLLIFVVVLTGLTIIVPLCRVGGTKVLRGNGALVLYFTCIGLGFMLIEVAQLERLIVFLGEPTYTLSVVLFTLLLSSGLGSFLTHRVHNDTLRKAGALRLVGLVAVLSLIEILTPRAVAIFASSQTPVRILVAAGILFPLGLSMGMAFPLGMKAANAASSSLTPWLWGVNGAASVCGSVLALFVALASGIAVSFWSGCACYALALTSFLWIMRRSAGRPADVRPKLEMDAVSNS